jgi:hypothetical protein
MSILKPVACFHGNKAGWPIKIGFEPNRGFQGIRKDLRRKIRFFNGPTSRCDFAKRRLPSFIAILSYNYINRPALLPARLM